MQDIILYIALVLALAFFVFRFVHTFFNKEKECGNGACGCETTESNTKG